MKKVLLYILSIVAFSFVTVTLSNCGGTEEETPCEAPPKPKLYTGGPIDEGGTLKLYADTTQGATYQWTGPNGFTSALQSPTIVNVTAAAIGTYTCTKTLNNCTSSPNSIEPFIRVNVTDPRDGQVYKAIKIGSQTWLAENLNYLDPNNTQGHKAYNNDPRNADYYGRLYNWQCASTIAFPGWHIPSKSEWETLINYLGGPATAGRAMKYSGTTWWNSPNTLSNNSSGFNAKGSGYYDIVATDFALLKEYAYYWTSTPYNSIMWVTKLTYEYINVDMTQQDKLNFYSVRLIKN